MAQRALFWVLTYVFTFTALPPYPDQDYLIPIAAVIIGMTYLDRKAQQWEPRST